MAILYHIYEEGNDSLDQGYIGITERTFSERFKEHCRPSSNIYEHIEYCNSRNSLRYKIVLEGSKWFVRELERSLRPTWRIGWNIAPGGGDPPTSTKESAKKAQETLRSKKYFESDKFKIVMEKTIQKVVENRKVEGYYNTEEFKNIMKKGPISGKKKRSYYSKPVKMYNSKGEFVKDYKSVRDASEEINLYRDRRAEIDGYRYIRDCCEGARKSYRSYTFKWKNKTQ